MTNPTIPRTDDFATNKTRHGTPTGANLHSRLGEPPCDACAAAKAKYDRRFRMAPKKTRLNRLRAKAQGRAEANMRRNHPEEYRLHYEAELAKILQEETP